MLYIRIPKHGLVGKKAPKSLEYLKMLECFFEHRTQDQSLIHCFFLFSSRQNLLNIRGGHSQIQK